MKKEMRQKIELLEQKMSKSPNLNGSRFLYRREKMIRFKLLLQNISQKTLAQYLKVTESYVSKLITGERYNQDFEFFLERHLEIHYGFI
ncbi:MAG: helix-turn-helix transcriptional regulator [Candidatus Gastranaerophilales bacterium]|nr:helix-turn-helix transcriptional regulator [Candidatus Gastranaerophilales bacterium]